MLALLHTDVNGGRIVYTFVQPLVTAGSTESQNAYIRMLTRRSIQWVVTWSSTYTAIQGVTVRDAITNGWLALY